MALVAFTCVCGAIYLASNDQEGWGWLLFIAFIIATN